MNSNADNETLHRQTRARLTLDREHRKLLGVCAGFARYLDVPAALVRVIYCVACLASPFLILIYFVMYWLLDDEERPERIKAAMTGFSGSRPSDTAQAASAAPDDTAFAEETVAGSRTQPQQEGRRFDRSRPLHRSRNARVAGVCAGLAEYLGLSTFLVRALTLLSLFILGAVTVWAYVIFWIVLDKEPKARKVTRKRFGCRGSAYDRDMDQQDDQEPDSRDERDRLSIDSCTTAFQATEQRLREVEAFITSKQFRLHCEINRI